MKLVGPRKKAQIFPKLPQKMHLTYQKHPHHFIEAYHTVGTVDKQCNVPPIHRRYSFRKREGGVCGRESDSQSETGTLGYLKSISKNITETYSPCLRRWYGPSSLLNRRNVIFAARH